MIARYVGIPYADRGRDPATGLDCWGLVRVFYAQEFGIELPSLDGRYERSSARAQVAAVAAEEIAAHWSCVGSPRFGDVVVLTVTGRPFHVGVVVDVAAQRFLHNLHPRQGAVIESWRSPRWAPRVEGFYRHASGSR